MRLHFALVAVAVAAVWPALVPDASVAAAPGTPGAVGGTWGTAAEGPGIAALDPGGGVGLGGQLRRGRGLRYFPRPWAGVRRQPDQRRLGHRPKCPWPRRPQPGP